jgi:4-hydroxybenzoate polyprenyltransferase
MQVFSSRLLGFFRVIRFPNLLFIALTQLLLQYCIYLPLYVSTPATGDHTRFLFLVSASVLIAAGGYVINDYFDRDIDEINKPARLVVGKWISKRGAILLHSITSVGGLFCTVFAAQGVQQFYLVLLNVGAIVLLWFYSVRFKKSLLIGNLLIALLVAWVLVIFFLSKFQPFQLVKGAAASQAVFYQLTMLYAGFAFLATFIRELIKDVEDMEGDRRHGCKTLPIVWGIPLATSFIIIWVVVFIVFLVVVMIFLLQLQMRMAFLYGLLFLLFPAMVLLKKLRAAHSPAEFGKLSTRMKWLLLAGIFSMIFFYTK